MTINRLLGLYWEKVSGRRCPNSNAAVPGLNVAGYISSESGVGEAVRANIRAAERVGIPLALYNIASLSRQSDDSFSDFTTDNHFPINLIQVNSDQTRIFYQNVGRKFFKNKYNIGFWYWELSVFPKEWQCYFDVYDEVWVASSFCQEAIALVSPIPVVKIPPAVVVEQIGSFDRSYLGVLPSTFVFLFMFDFFSLIERKNPYAVIRAFRAAFSPSDDVLLVVKCSNSDKKIMELKHMMEMANGLRIKFIDDYLKKEEVNALVSICDCYVSLHRSEGFGLPLAEAMFLQKPVIATGYSGNMEFMDNNNSLLVKHTLVEIDSDHGPYKKGSVWANPDLDHAAQQMRLVYDNRNLAKSIGERAAIDIKTSLSYEVIGQKISTRLTDVVNNKRV